MNDYCYGGLAQIISVSCWTPSFHFSQLLTVQSVIRISLGLLSFVPVILLISTLISRILPFPGFNKLSSVSSGFPYTFYVFTKPSNPPKFRAKLIIFVPGITREIIKYSFHYSKSYLLTDRHELFINITQPRSIFVSSPFALCSLFFFFLNPITVLNSIKFFSLSRSTTRSSLEIYLSRIRTKQICAVLDFN